MHRLRFYIIYTLIAPFTFLYNCAYSVECNRFFLSQNGESIIGLPLNFYLEISPDGLPLIVCVDGRIYKIHTETNTIEKQWGFGSPCSIEFSPNKTKVLIHPDDGTKHFYVLDWPTQKIVAEGDDTANALSFLNEGRFLFNRNHTNSADLYDLDRFTMQKILCDGNIRQVVSILPEEQCLIGLYGEKYCPDQSYWYKIDNTYYCKYNYESVLIENRVLLSNSYQQDGFDSPYSDFRLFDFFTPNLQNNEIAGISKSTNRYTYGARFYSYFVWDIKDGSMKNQINDFSISGYSHPSVQKGVSFEISSDYNWLIIQDPLYGIVDLSDYEFAAGPFETCKSMTFDEKNLRLYLLEKNNPLLSIRSYDVASKTDFWRQSFLQSYLDENEAAFLSQNTLLTYSKSNSYLKWDFENNSVDNLSFPNINQGAYTNVQVSPNGETFVGSNSQAAFIFSASGGLIHSVTVTETDKRNYVQFNHDGTKFLTASGNQDTPGVDNLIRIWDAETFEMQREIRGHANSVWYAEFSPDDRRIVSASLDGTAKVWDAASGLMVCEFVGHATGVEYAAFMPDGGRVMSVGRDRRAFLWTAENAEVEKTFENVHLPAQLSPDGKYLFAGSEVWDIETGERIKTLDGVAQDYSCLTLSPDGTMLLTSEYEGFTKVWNVQEHILKPSGVWDYSVHE